ncbi:MAG: SulP family inorganic anion transporter [Bdellovibrionales bacterium]
MTFNKQTFSQDLFASFVVFLVALPLCLGISIASGVDPVKGILTGIIGGIVVGFLSGSPLQISGPSAGLAVMVFHVVETYGVHALVPLGIVVGLFQLITATFKVAHFFQATPPALLKGMLSGIGALILLAQFYIMFDLPMHSNGLQNLVGAPKVLIDLFGGELSIVQTHSALVAGLVMLVLFLWGKGSSAFFELIPGPLISTVMAGVFVYFAGWEMKMVHLPADFISDALNINYAEAFSAVNLSFLIYAVGFAFVASAETLLCVSAVDKMAKTTSKYNKHIFAQGVGNISAGLIGGLPIIGVITRSAANIEFGAKTKMSSILHGIWIALVLMVPGLLSYIPVPALAGLLIYIGIKLLDVTHMFDYVRKYNKTSIIFFTTFFLTVGVDLLVGVLAGFMVSIFILVFDVLKYDLQIQDQGENKVLKFKGKLSFLDLPVLSKTLQNEDMDDATNLEICLQEVEYLDPAINEHLNELKNKLEAQGKNIEIKYSKFNVH